MSLRKDLTDALVAHRKDLVGHSRDLIAHGAAEYARALEDAALWCDGLGSGAPSYTAMCLRDGTVKRLADESRPEEVAEAAAAKVREDRHTEAMERLRVAEEDGWRVPLACLVGLEPTGDWDSIYDEVRLALEAKMPDHVDQCLRERNQICDNYALPGDQNMADHVDRIIEQLQLEREIIVEEEVARRVAQELENSRPKP